MRPHALAALLAAPRNQQRGSGSLVRHVSVRGMDLPQLPVEELADLRDTLLPQLVTGKLRVKDAARIVEDDV